MDEPAVTIDRFPDPAALRREAEALLLATEAEDNLLFGLLGELERGEWEPAYLALARGPDERPVACALRTRGHRLVLSQATTPGTARAFVADLEADLGAEALPGVQGTPGAAAAAAEAWLERRGGEARTAVRLGTYRLDRVRPPAGVPGSMRPAREADRERIARWFAAFDADTGHHTPDFDADEVAARWLAPGRRLAFWERDGEPVAMAGAAGATPHGIRVAAVYTPPEHRRRGYAAALTASFSAELLAAGHRFCFLFTDLANPTSNGVYRRIGYEFVTELVALDLRP